MSTFDHLLARITRAPGERDAIEVRAPFTGEPLVRIPRCMGEDVARAAETARAAQARWSARPVRERTRVLLRLHDLVLDRQAEALDLIQLETGKARRDAFEEVVDVALVARYYAYHGPAHLRTRRRRGILPLLTSARELRHPVGLVGLIVPWNYPLVLALNDALPALLAGNAAIVKPDPQTSLAALWAAELLEAAGLPPGLFQVVTGEGPELGPALIGEVDHVAFTGSTATGRLIARQAAERLVGCSLELGGKNPVLVLADAPVQRTARGVVRASFANAGQLCVSFERVFVHADVWDRFVPRLVELTRVLRLGAGLDWTVDVGSLLSARQLAQVEAHVRDALEKGATLLAGGRARPDVGPYFYEPTVLADVTPEMALWDEESFGPVVALQRFESEEEAVERANASRYGLNAAVWTRDVRRGAALAARLRAGTVSVNEGYGATWGSTDAPLGGVKESGLGRRHGAEGILRFTEAQAVVVQLGLAIAPAAGMPEDAFARLATRLLRLTRRLPGLR